MLRIKFPTKTKWTHMFIYFRSGGRGPQTFGIVISSEVLFKYELEPPSSTPGGDRHMHPRIFCRKLNSKQPLFKAFFDGMRIFVSVES